MFSIILFSALLGWCGPFFGTRRPILGPDPKPGPDPDPIKRTISDPMPGIVAGVIGAIGGIAAGYVIHSQNPELSLGIIGLAAFAGGRVVFDVVNSFRGY